MLLKRKYGSLKVVVETNKDGTISAQPVKLGSGWYLLRADEIEKRRYPTRAHVELAIIEERQLLDRFLSTIPGTKSLRRKLKVG